MRKRIFFLLVACMLFPGCAANQMPAPGSEAANEATALALDDYDRYLEEAYDTQIIPDPLEPWNRLMFEVNDVIITYVARPVSDAYIFVVPQPVRTGFGNFFTNWLFPVRFVNNLLQANPERAYKEFARFFINTGAGLGGFIDVASTEPALQNVPPADLGQTFAKWGFGEGFYLYWPLLGPSNPRDTVGTVGDWFMDPLTYVKPWYVSLPVKTLRTVNGLDEVLDTYDSFTKSAIEPYTAIRDGYTQYRRARIAR